MLRDHLLCADFSGHVKRNWLLIPGSHDHPGHIVFYISQRAGNNISNAVDQANGKLRAFIHSDGHCLFWDELGLRSHNRPASSGLGHFIHRPVSPVFLFDIGNDNAFHKPLDKRRFTCTNRAYYANENRTSRPFGNIGINCPFLHISPLLILYAQESATYGNPGCCLL